ncbi:hypothetical protein EJB05_08529, partial [Eragrostis curvula]
MPPPSKVAAIFLFTTFAILCTAPRLTFGFVHIPTWLDCPSPPPSPSPSPPPLNTTTTTTTKFQDNVVRLLEALPSSAAPTGFSSISRGNGGDRAFVRGLCRGDVPSADCEACLRNASAEIHRNCSSNQHRQAGLWYENCFVGYADINASDYQEGFRQEMFNQWNVSDKSAFENTYYQLMARLSARAVNGTPESPPATAPMFATGEAVFDRDAANGTMYGLVQCARDRTPAECGQCLQDSVPRLPICCYGHQGGVVVSYNCYLRVEIYTYYDLALDRGQLEFPPPAPSPSSLGPFPGEGQDCGA